MQLCVYVQITSVVIEAQWFTSYELGSPKQVVIISGQHNVMVILQYMQERAGSILKTNSSLEKMALLSTWILEKCYAALIVTVV